MLQKIITSHKLPSKSLKKYINKYWIAHNPTDESIDIPIVPDGCMDIICKNGYFFISGLMESADVISIKPQDNYFGIQFKPYALALLLNEDVSKFNNKSVELECINFNLKNQITKILENNSQPYEQLDLYFEALFLDKIIEPKLLEAIEMITISSGNILVTDLVKELEIHPKKLERLFVKYLGVSVKKFSKIIRFHNIHSVLREEGLEDLIQKILDKGYFDQAHFNRDFKKLTGLTPTSKLMSILYNT